MADRPYLYYELTNSICTTCHRKVEAKIVFQDERGVNFSSNALSTYNNF